MEQPRIDLPRQHINYRAATVCLILFLVFSAAGIWDYRDAGPSAWTVVVGACAAIFLLVPVAFSGPKTVEGLPRSFLVVTSAWALITFLLIGIAVVANLINGQPLSALGAAFWIFFWCWIVAYAVIVVPLWILWGVGARANQWWRGARS
jgi:hypothetical protein